MLNVFKRNRRGWVVVEEVRMRKELGHYHFEAWLSLGWKQQRSEEKHFNDFLTKSLNMNVYTGLLVNRHSSRLMRSGKTSNKSNLSCYDHELIPVCLSSDELSTTAFHLCLQLAPI